MRQNYHLNSDRESPMFAELLVHLFHHNNVSLWTLHVHYSITSMFSYVVPLSFDLVFILFAFVNAKGSVA